LGGRRGVKGLLEAKKTARIKRVKEKAQKIKKRGAETGTCRVEGNGGGGGNNFEGVKR